jgi:hypothetical protein
MKVCQTRRNLGCLRIGHEHPKIPAKLDTYQPKAFRLKVAHISIRGNIVPHSLVDHPPRDDGRIVGSFWIAFNPKERQNMRVVNICPCDYFLIKILPRL